MTAAPRPAWPIRALVALEAWPRLAVALAAALPVLLSIGNPPLLDDGWAALDNPLTWSLRNAGRIFAAPYGFAGEATLGGPYRPVATLSYALNHAVHGRWPPGYHLVNVALHVAASLLVLALARRLAQASRPARPARVALLGGLLFAVHPAHVEAVATISGRNELLAACFALWALLLALGRRVAAWRLPAALALLVAGVLSKEVAIVTPALFAVVAVALPAAAGLETRPGLGAGAPRRALREVALVALLLLAALVPYLVGRGAALAAPPEARWFPEGTAGWQVALTMSRVLGEYLRILAFPAFLGSDFAYAARVPLQAGPSLGLAVATAAWVGTLAVAALALRRAPLVAAGLAWIFVALTPVLQLVPVGVLMAERLLYLPSVGFCLAVAAAVGAAWRAAPDARAAPRPGPPLAAALALGLVALLAVRSSARTLDWHDEVRFWTAELGKAPRDVVVNNNLAVALQVRGDYAGAVERLRVVLEVHPRYWRAHVNLGICLGEQGDRAAARRSFERALALAPGSADPRYFYARWLGKVEQREEALRLLAEARVLRPDEARLPLLEGELLLELGRIDEARAALGRAAALDPKDRRPRSLLERLPAAPGAGP